MKELINLDFFYLKANRHANDPYNLGSLDPFNGHAKITGPCGDTMEFWIHVLDGKIADVSFITDGCGPSLAAGSMTTCLAKGKNVDEAIDITQQDVLDALDGLPESSRHCALLAANTLAAACDDYFRKQIKEDRKKSGKSKNVQFVRRQKLLGKKPETG